jgi:hypothetical protein
MCGSGSALGATRLVLLDYEKQAQAFSTLSVRVQITNDGAAPLSECPRSEAEPSVTPGCVAVAYRGSRRPPQLAFSRLERAPFLPGVMPIAPGATLETTVQVETPRRAKDYVVYLYLVTGAGGQLAWAETVLRVKVGDPPPAIAGNIRRTRLLAAIYVLGTSGAVTAVLLTRRRRRRH